MSPLEKAFWDYHRERPEVYGFMVQFARQWKIAGKGKLGISLLAERVRWECELNSPTEEGEFKLNNNHRAYYARLIMAQEPDLAGIFQLRKQKIASTIPGEPTSGIVGHVAPTRILDETDELYEDDPD